MKPIALSICHEILSSKVVQDFIKDLINKNPRSLFLVDFVPPAWMEELLEKKGSKRVPYYPSLSKFTSKSQAYLNRAFRIAKKAHECYVIFTDTSTLPRETAIEFNKQHPLWLLCCYEYVDGKLVIAKNLEEPKQWERLQYKQ